MTDHLSPSSVNLWRRCKYAWHLRYERCLPPRESEATVVGRAVHGYLEHIVRAAMDLGVEWARDAWTERVVAIPLPDGDAGRLAAMLRGRVLSVWDQPLAAEMGVRTARDGYDVVGFVDVITRDGAEDNVIRELKTSLSARPPVWDRYHLQAATYSWLTGIGRVIITHVSVGGIAEVRYDCGRAVWDSVARVYDDTWHSICTGQREPSPGPQCRWCDYGGSLGFCESCVRWTK